MLAWGTGRSVGQSRGAETGLRNLSQGPDAEGLATAHVFTMPVLVSFRRDEQ